MDDCLKVCTKCKKELPVSNFYKASSKKSGYKSHCKQCISDKRKESYNDPVQYKRRIENHWKKIKSIRL